MMNEVSSMEWQQQLASAPRRIAVAAIAVLSLAPSVGRAQSQYDVFASGALAIAAYEASKERCAYSEKLAKALADIDAFLNRQDAYRWEESKRLAPDGMTGARNMARMQGASDCKVYGLFIGNAGIVYFNLAEFDQAVFAEFNELQKGEGRSISGEAEARSPQPPPPGSAAAIIAELNRQNPTMNQSADTGGRASTLRQLPADDGAPPASRSRPAPRQSAEPTPRRERTSPAPLAQVAPSAAPPTTTPSFALPNAAPQPTPPTASLFSDCPVAGDCRLAQPTFACNLDDAARLAGLGPVAGRQAGLAAVRAGACEIVAAGRSLKIEATKAPNVVYATEQGRHVGYVPVGVASHAAQAQFPRELQGRWYNDRRACTDPRRYEPDYDEFGWMVISANGRVGSQEFEWPQRIDAVRALDRGAWEIDGSHRIDDPSEPEIHQKSTYRLTHDGFELRQQGRVSEWVRCR